MYYGKWNETIDTLIRHLSLPSATWKDERGASMRFIARCYKELKRYDESKLWLDKAMKETPNLRDPFVEMALLGYIFEEWEDVEYYSLKALSIKKKIKTYINEVFSWNNTIYDLLALSYFYQGFYELSLKYVDLALSMAPNNERLLKNKKIIEEKNKN